MVMKKFALAALSIAALIRPAIAEAADGTRAPTNKWTVDFGERQCLASRNYGSAASPLFLALKAPAVGDVVAVMIVRPGQDTRFAQQGDALIGLDGKRILNKSALLVTSQETKQRVMRMILSAEEFDEFARANAADFKIRGEVDEKLALSQMPGMAKTLRNCIAALRTHWNIGAPDGPPLLRQGAMGNLQGIFSSDDFPNIAMNKDQGGTVRVSLLIDESGKVADCTVVESSGAASLDSQSCYVITKRAQFKPALGLDGRAARSSLTQRITWRPKAKLIGGEASPLPRN